MSKTRKVMIVDDDDIHNYLFSRRIKNSGLADEIISFLEGKDALNFLSENRNYPDLLPDIIFLDILMPGFDGWDFINEYEQIYPYLNKESSTFMLSSSVSPHDLERAEKHLLIVDYIQKPLMEDELFMLQDRFFAK